MDEVISTQSHLSSEGKKNPSTNRPNDGELLAMNTQAVLSSAQSSLPTQLNT